MEFLEKLKIKLRPDRDLRPLFEEIKKKLQPYFPDAKIELYGSVAKGTHLKDAADLDIFVFFSPDTEKEEMGKRVIEACKREFDTIVKYAEHPYAHIKYKDIEADVVPGYAVSSPAQVKSAVDRTPFHYKFVIEHMTSKQKDEVRLLKKFLKTAGLYGAEIKVSGFSGYLCELLIIKYGTFLKVLRATAKWKKQEILYFSKPSYDPKIRFAQNSLVFIDPVDERRNAAAAVSRDSYDRFILYARAFLNRPSELFFSLGRKQAPKVVGIMFEHNINVEDILFGQLKRYLRAMVNYLESREFLIIKKFVFANRKHAFICVNPLYKRIEWPALHEGPEVYSEKHSRRFMKGDWFYKDGKLWKIKNRNLTVEDEIRRFIRNYSFDHRYKVLGVFWNPQEFQNEVEIEAYREWLLRQSFE